MKIGLITYHSAYNFGSVLQAYATQEIIDRYFGNCEIINYRSIEQKRVYSIFKWEKGIKGFFKSLIKNLLSLTDYKLRKSRQVKYENTFLELFNLSQEVNTYEELKNMWDKYDLIISGSDQIWNKHSNELENVEWEFMYPYLLRGYKGHKISYASSITNMSDSEIDKIIEDVRLFDSVSLREHESYIKLSKSFNLKCTNVIDPTWLLNKDDWINKLSLTKNYSEKYLLYYALNKRSEISQILSDIKDYASKKNLKIKMIMPLNFMGNIEGVEILKDIDPIDFMNLIYNADTVVTDSYHGTILSVNLEKNIYSICKGYPSDFRKVDILNRIGLNDRVINDTKELLKQEFSSIDYKEIKKSLDVLRENSINYLKESVRRINDNRDM